MSGNIRGPQGNVAAGEAEGAGEPRLRGTAHQPNRACDAQGIPAGAGGTGGPEEQE